MRLDQQKRPQAFSAAGAGFPDVYPAIMATQSRDSA
jgi:hypothetical protein